jgi:hemerythrin
MAVSVVLKVFPAAAMSGITWQECYETKIVVLDKEPQRLVEQISRPFQAILKKNPEAVLLSIFDELVACPDNHFSHEERLQAEAMGVLRNWLLDHIVKHDQQYGPYLEARGGRLIS